MQALASNKVWFTVRFSGYRETPGTSAEEESTKFSLHTFFFKRKYAPLAQLVEQLTLNQWVPGSNP